MIASCLYLLLDEMAQLVVQCEGIGLLLRTVEVESGVMIFLAVNRELHRARLVMRWCELDGIDGVGEHLCFFMRAEK